MKCTCDVIKIKMFLVMFLVASSLAKLQFTYIDYFDNIDPQKMSYEYVNIFYKE